MDKICGQWRVDMLDWWIGEVKMPRCFWWWFRNVKLIWQNPDGSIQGCNILWGWLKWGEFKVSSCTPYSHRFQYAHFHDSVFYHFHDDRSAGFPVRVIDSKDIADGYLYRKYKLRATFTMTRILPEKAA